MSLQWGPIHARLHRTLRQRQLLPRGSAVLVAVSGGQDSLALLRLLLDLQPKWDWRMAIAHCDHRWRPRSGENAAYVCQLAQQWHVPCYLRTASDDVASRMTSEAAARDWRYRQLAEMALCHGYGHLVTGHTASDRAETLLYNLIRGSGADGLQALTWCRKLVLAADGASSGDIRLCVGLDVEIDNGDGCPETLQLVRPMLNILRQETAQLCLDCDLHVWDDETNRNLRYARNRIRHELIPYLRTAFNPGVEVTIAQTAEILRAEVDYLDAQVDGLWARSVHMVSRGSSGQTICEVMTQPVSPPLNRYCVRRSPLQGISLALQRRLLRRLLIQTNTALSFRQVEALVGLIDAPNRTQTAPLSDGVIGYVEGEWIRFKTLRADGTDHHPSE